MSIAHAPVFCLEEEMIIMMVALASTNYSPEPDKEKANVIWKLWFVEIFLL